MRDVERSGAALTIIVMAMASAPVAAHRLDEYLQAARISLEPARVEVAMELTPGIELADPVIADMDLDGDELISADEQRAYVASVLSAVELQIDGRSLHVKPLTVAFPDIDAMRRGEGTIQIRYAGELASVANGKHRLLFRNMHRPDIGVYLANALVPESDRIAITAQHRDGNQHELTVDYTVGTSVLSIAAWLFTAIVGAVLLTTLVTRAKSASHLS